MSTCKILIDRLRNGSAEKIEGSLNPEVLGPDEKDLKFPKPVEVKGEAYLTDDHLIIHLKAATIVSMPCSICNQMIEAKLMIDHFYHAEPIENVKNAIFDYQNLLREALLLELPLTIECNEGKCPERESMKSFMRHENPTNFPFADIDEN